MIIYYVRHGDPIYDPDSLTEYGQKQAEWLKPYFAEHPLDAIYSSTSNRAYLTAKPTADMFGLTPVQVDWANEGHVGAAFFKYDKEEKRSTWCYNITKYCDLFRSAEVQSLGDEWYEYEGFKDEGFKEGILNYKDGLDGFMESIGYKHNRRDHSYAKIGEGPHQIGFFAHGGSGMVFLSSILDIPYPYFVTHFVEHVTTGISVIKFADSGDCIRPRLMCFNQTPHLFRVGERNQFDF